MGKWPWILNETDKANRAVKNYRKKRKATSGPILKNIYKDLFFHILISDLKNLKNISNHSWKSEKENKNSHPQPPTNMLSNNLFRTNSKVKKHEKLLRKEKYNGNIIESITSISFWKKELSWIFSDLICLFGIFLIELC